MTVRTTGIFAAAALTLGMLFSACAVERTLVLPVDLRFSAVYFEGIENETGLTTFPHWPEDTSLSRVLFAVFDAMGERFRGELVQYSRKGGYSMADRPDMAQVLVRLRFLPAEMRHDSLVLPVLLRVQDNRSGEVREHRFATGADYTFPKDTSDTRFGYHYYGVLLGQAGRSFPVESMGRLFYPHVQEDY